MPKIHLNAGALLAPVPPAMVTCGSFEEANIITIAWTGILNTIPPKTYISVRPERYSYKIIKKSREFAVNLPNVPLARSVDYCGMRSGAKLDKFKSCRLTKETAATIACPLIAECPVSLECKVFDIIHLGSHDMFMADITSIGVDESLIDTKGKIHIEKAGLLAYAHGAYFTLGKKLGAFGFSVKKRKK